MMITTLNILHIHCTDFIYVNWICLVFVTSKQRRLSRNTDHKGKLLRLRQFVILVLELCELFHLLRQRHILEELLNKSHRQLVLIHLYDPPLDLLVRDLYGSQQDRCDRQSQTNELHQLVAVESRLIPAESDTV